VSGWITYPTELGSEVMPDDDAAGHEPGDDCACLPYVEYLGKANDGADAWMIVHHAWDGRE
jgi:hypothetical protein